MPNTADVQKGANAVMENKYSCEHNVIFFGLIIVNV